MNGILNDQYSHDLANWVNNMQVIEHQERMNLLIGEQQYLLVKTYGLVPFKDGDKWCVLLGDNIQDGISGFGDSPNEAVLSFNNAFHNKV